MKKLLFLVGAVVAVLLVLSGIGTGNPLLIILPPALLLIAAWLRS